MTRNASSSRSVRVAIGPTWRGPWGTTWEKARQAAWKQYCDETPAAFRCPRDLFGRCCTKENRDA